MKRWIRSIGRAQGAHRQNANHVARPVIAPEPLEGRVLMAAQLSSSAMLGKLSGPVTTNTTSTSQPAIAGPTGGLLEGDDRISNAGKKNLDFTASTDISQKRDVDMFKFTVSKDQRVEFDIDRPAGSVLDSALRIFDKSGRELAFNDDAAAQFEAVATVDAAIDFTFSNAGTYYVGVSASGNDSYNAISGFGDVNGNTTGKYKLIATKLPPPDPNDTIDEAEHVLVEDFLTGKIEAAGDVDFFAFDVYEGQTVSFDIEQLAVEGPGDTVLRLFDYDGNELAYNDDGQAPDEAGEPDLFGESYIEHTFDAAGTYYIAVSGGRVSSSPLDFGNDLYNPIDGDEDKPGAIGRYGLRITDTANYLI